MLQLVSRRLRRIRFVPLALAALVGTSLACATALPAAPAMAQDTKDKKDPVVATVNGEKVFLSDVLAEREALGPRYRSVPIANLFKPLLERAIQRKLVAQQGRKEKLDQTDDFKKPVKRYQDAVLYQLYLVKLIDSKLTDAVLKARYDEYVAPGTFW